MDEREKNLGGAHPEAKDGSKFNPEAYGIEVEITNPRHNPDYPTTGVVDFRRTSLRLGTLLAQRQRQFYADNLYPGATLTYEEMRPEDYDLLIKLQETTRTVVELAPTKIEITPERTDRLEQMCLEVAQAVVTHFQLKPLDGRVK